MDNPEQEMGFFDHLDALRGHLFRSAVAVLLVTVICLIKSSWLFDSLLFGPLQKDFLTYSLLCKITTWLQPLLCQTAAFLCPEKPMCVESLSIQLMNTELFGQFITQIQTAVVFGLIVAFPYIIYEIWKFVKPALSETESKKSGRVVLFSALFFYAGALFSYFLIIPFSLHFASSYTVSHQINNMFTLENYIGFLTMMCLGSGIVFELPMVVFFLAKFGLITASFMRSYRRHAVVVILIVASFITPSPDMFTMLIVAIPIYFLFELSILVAAKVNPEQ